MLEIPPKVGNANRDQVMFNPASNHEFVYRWSSKNNFTLHHTLSMVEGFNKSIFQIELKSQNDLIYNIWFGLVYGIPTFVGYWMPKPSL